MCCGIKANEKCSRFNENVLMKETSSVINILMTSVL